MSFAVAHPGSDAALEFEIRQGLKQLGMELDQEAVRKLLAYLSLLAKWNRTYNLTAVREPRTMVSVHLLDSLAIARLLSGHQVLDVGSGAGLPGIPLAIAWPQAEMTLLDSKQKKAAFLRQAVASLGLRNASVVAERVEHWHPLKRFDLIISRAYAQTGDFVRSASHLLEEGGILAAMKGLRPESELTRVPAEFKVREVRALAVPNLDAERHLVILERA